MMLELNERSEEEEDGDVVTRRKSDCLIAHQGDDGGDDETRQLKAVHVNSSQSLSQSVTLLHDSRTPGSIV